MFRFGVLVLMLFGPSASAQSVTKTQCEKATPVLQTLATTISKVISDQEKDMPPAIKQLSSQSPFMERSVTKYSEAQKAYLEASKNYRNAIQDFTREVQLCAR